MWLWLATRSAALLLAGTAIPLVAALVMPNTSPILRMSCALACAGFLVGYLGARSALLSAWWLPCMIGWTGSLLVGVRRDAPDFGVALSMTLAFVALAGPCFVAVSHLAAAFRARRLGPNR